MDWNCSAHSRLSWSWRFARTRERVTLRFLSTGLPVSAMVETLGGCRLGPVPGREGPPPEWLLVAYPAPEWLLVVVALERRR
jgi:hypothetical protein